ncbi:ABC transporter permease [Nocardioides sp. Kera G14]|uniref:ABC transporter permease n=1 Tax=Nocardioides sp. Kera G14 TaxID=2884264 RepID=UPI001D121F32|nr:ABC transporter permease [Nocardioides sp. Kera G14]UDY24411.1 ABC transporter permease [Nocardioides sp. Kera G14]
MKLDPRRVGLTLAAPVLAIVFAMIVTSLVLIAAGDPVGKVWSTIFSEPRARNVVNMINSASMLYLSGLAAAIGFRMNLFNIGVDGQYRVAAFVAAWVAGEAWLPGKANVVLTVVVAMAVGAAWAGIAGLLRVTRGVSEVITTIMLNSIASALVAYMLRKVAVVDGNNIHTKTIPVDSQLKGLSWISGAPNTIYTLVFLAILAGVVYWILLSRTVFGFNLRATGQSETAAVASGVNVKRMIVISMLLSGAVAGLIGLPLLFGDQHNYGLTFQTGLGFAGIAVALLGRNNPVGVAFAAFLFAFLNEQSNKLQLMAGVSNDIVNIIQGVIVLSVVVAYEVVRRVNNAAEQRAVARKLEVQEVAA